MRDASARGAASAACSSRSPRGGRGGRGSRGSRAAGASAGGALATGAGAGGGASIGAASAVADFFGRPRGFFTGASSAVVSAWAGGAVTTAAGASPLSLYGFGSSPCAVLRGVRGPRPSAGRRRSVMESMCYVVTGHGTVKKHRRARRTHDRVTSSGNQGFTCHAIDPMRGQETALMKNLVGSGPGNCTTPLECCDDTSDRRS